MIRRFGLKMKCIFGVGRELLSRRGKYMEYLLQNALRADLVLKPEHLLSGLY